VGRRLVGGGFGAGIHECSICSYPGSGERTTLRPNRDSPVPAMSSWWVTTGARRAPHATVARPRAVDRSEQRALRRIGTRAARVEPSGEHGPVEATTLRRAVDAAFARTSRGMRRWDDPHPAPERLVANEEYSRVTDPARWR